MKPVRTQRRQEGHQGSYLHCALYTFSMPLPVINRPTFFCFLLIFCSFTATFALSPNEDKNFNPSYPNYLAHGFKNILTDRTNQWILGSAALSTLLAHTYDDDVQEYASANGLMSESLSGFLDDYGGGYAYPVGLAIVGVTSYLEGGKESFVSGIKYYVTALGVTALITDFLKRSVGRERPNGQGTRSFPTGHTSGSFVLASVADELYGHKLGIPVYLLAAFVGLQRIHDNKHWLTDVIAGATLGTIIGRGFGKAYQKEVTNSRMTIHPEIGGDGIRLMLSISIK